MKLLIAQESLFSLRCYQLLRRQEFDIVHCLHYSDAIGVSASQFSRKTPFVVHVTFLPVAFRRRILENLFFRLAVRRATEVVAVSRKAAHLTEQIFHRKVTAMPVPCDVERFRLREGRDLERPIILAAGAFAETRKGALILIRAFELLKQSVPHARLRYSGPVPADMQQKLLTAVSERTRVDVEFLGVGQPEDLPEIYGRAAVTVLPAVREGLGMTLIEALACGTPVVGSNDGGMTDVIREGVGTLFDPGDLKEPTNSAGLAEAIRRTLALYSAPDLHQRCRLWAEQFSWQTLGPRLLECYHAAIAQ